MEIKLSAPKIWLACEPVDFRKAIDGLSEVVSRDFNNALEDHIYVFYNRDSVAIFAKDFRPSLPPKIGKNDATANYFCRGRPRHKHFARFACYVFALRWLYGCIKICRASLRAVLQIAAYHGLRDLGFASPCRAAVVP